VRRIGLLLAPCLALALLTGCERGDKDDQGPLAATVAGEKVTVAQLDAELKVDETARPGDPKARSAALQRIIVRKLMAKSARDDKLDQQPDAQRLKRAAIETFEAGLAQNAVLAKVPNPTPAEVAAFVGQHPEQFARRTLYLADQLRLPTVPDPALGRALGPANTFEAVEGVLRERHTTYTRSVEQLDTLRADPRLSAKIAELPPGELFVLPIGNGVSINRIRASKAMPISGEAANRRAAGLLREQRRQKAVAGRMEALLRENQARISYGPGFGPPVGARE
jgi:EpsD family peptidyl-prolyl cis-trans isomerase